MMIKMVKNRLGCSLSGEPKSLLQGLTHNKSPRKPKIMDDRELDEGEARYRNLECQVQTF
jgi:hypothetical protein